MAMHFKPLQQQCQGCYPEVYNPNFPLHLDRSIWNNVEEINPDEHKLKDIKIVENFAVKTPNILYKRKRKSFSGLRIIRVPESP